MSVDRFGADWSLDIRLANGSAATIRPATVKDATAIVEFLNEVGGETDFLSFGANEFSMTPTEEAAHIRSLEDPAKGAMVVAVADQMLAGLATLTRASRPRFRHGAELAVSVRRSHWGRGLGRRLCESIIAIARQTGVRRLSLFVRSDNVRAIDLYRILGFETEGRHRGSMAIGEGYFDELTMAMWLDPAGDDRRIGHTDGGTRAGDPPGS